MRGIKKIKDLKIKRLKNLRTPNGILTFFSFLIFAFFLMSCRQEDDTIIYQQSRRWVEKTVAVVAPMSSDAATKARFERTAQWFLDNLHQAQLHDTLCVELKLEWHDELTENLEQLGEELAYREDVMAIIGPFSNDGVALLAPACQEMQKPVIAPTATSEEVIRRFAVGTAGVKNKRPFLWALTETDITFCEVLMNMYASFVKTLGYELETSTPAAMFSPNDSYGRTFFDWGPYQAEEMGIPFSHNEQYTDDADLRRRMKDYYDELTQMPTFGSFDIGNFCVIETIQQLYDIAQVRMEWWEIDPSDPFYQGAKEDIQEILEGWGRTYFAFSNLTQESLDALGQRGADILQHYQGFSPYADPTTGFEKSYEVKFGTKPTFAECKFYDALMLAAFAASYIEHSPLAIDHSKEAVEGEHGQWLMVNGQFNDAVVKITTPHAQQLGGAAWSATSMELYLNALERGQLMDFKGASGDICFDSENYTSAVSTTYVHWQIQNGKIEHRNYLSSDGSHRTSSTMAAWNWLVENAEEAFASEAENKETGITYPALTDQYALLVQGSNGWNNYRHQADVLSMYQLLRKNGYDDDHIIIIIDKALANDKKNTEAGIIRAADDGPDLLANTVIDYDNGALSPADISNILLGNKTAATPVVLPKDAGQNVLLFWSGHGHNRASNGADELAWCHADIGQGMTADLLQQTISQMQQQRLYRKMLILTEPCFSEAVITPLIGITGVLAMSSAGSYEQSFADNWSSSLGVWRCDRFSHNLITHLTASPSTTYRDLYLYCAHRTLGSHVHIVNSAHFDNLYTAGPQEFFQKR
jgi:glycosylphosphatidylinositol transamidase (GPIT) subunit GPI8